MSVQSSTIIKTNPSLNQVQQFINSNIGKSFYVESDVNGNIVKVSSNDNSVISNAKTFNASLS